MEINSVFIDCLRLEEVESDRYDRCEILIFLFDI